MKVKSESEVAQSCPTLLDPMDHTQPTRLLRPWDSPGKSTGVGCHCLLQTTTLMSIKKRMKRYIEVFSAAAKSLQSCSILCDPIDGSPPGSPVPGILQARTLEWVAISFSNA